jgi:hypothetical protein
LTLLTIVQSAAVRAGFGSIPSSAVGNIDQNVQQLVSFAQDAGRELVERANWVNLDTAGSVTGDGVTTLFQLPQDWTRFSPSDKSPRGALISSKYPWFPLQGPVNTEDLNILKALPASTVRPVWRIIGGALEIWPALSGPPSVKTGIPVNIGLPVIVIGVPINITLPTPPTLPGEIVTFNYYSSFWIMNSARTVSRAQWVADDDFSLINEDTIMKGVVWRWKASKGLDYAEDFRAYEMSFARNAGQQQTERVVSTSRKYTIGDETFLGTITDLTSPLL